MCHVLRVRRILAGEVKYMSKGTTNGVWNLFDVAAGRGLQFTHRQASPPPPVARLYGYRRQRAGLCHRHLAVLQPPRYDANNESLCDPCGPSASFYKCSRFEVRTPDQYPGVLIRQWGTSFTPSNAASSDGSAVDVIPVMDHRADV